jgi:hypothetical protein
MGIGVSAEGGGPNNPNTDPQKIRKKSEKKKKNRPTYVHMYLALFSARNYSHEYTLPENKRGRKRGTTKQEEEEEALEATTRNQKSEQSRSRERERDPDLVFKSIN